MVLRRSAQKDSPWPSNLVNGATFDIGEIDTNAITVSVQLTGQGGEDLAVPAKVEWHVSDHADGTTLATAVNGGVAAGDAGLIISRTAGRHGFAVSDADGMIDFVLTDSGNPTVYLVIHLPGGGLEVSDAINFTEPGTA